jgi:two-component system NtrC family response regulator/two-component system response regulator AtoC
MKRDVHVLVVDDDVIFRTIIQEQLAHSGFDVTVTADGESALKVLLESDFDVVLLDVQMPGMSGIDTLSAVRMIENPPEVIMLTGDTSLSTGLQAMRLGAYDYLTKPSNHDEMEALILKANEKRRLVRQNASLRSVVRASDIIDPAHPGIVSNSAAMAEIVRLAKSVAPFESTIVITGESGTGKDVLARFVHAHSQRRDAPLVALNCGAVPEALFESEFFGHERGAFTGANTMKRGLVEVADGSTLFLDEVGDLPFAMQVKLLHFLEQGVFRRVGATRDQRADVRVIAATHRNLRDDVGAGRFRADLFYRLNVVSIHIPPLRERPDDIAALTDIYLGIYRKRFKRPALALSDAARTMLQNYSWPGNVRELRNCLERAVALSNTERIEAGQIIHQTTDAGLRQADDPHAAEGSAPPVPLADIERGHILHVLQQAHANRERAAAMLGISARTLYRKLREYESPLGAAAQTTDT